ncbi:MAG: hypothetical protein QOE07_2873 [Acidimicrobiaceae bacterium]|jgi:hypothetical protein|nr:hypothetical protein [Acidimicrobiaceae bacterium]MDQ1376471.1 hypothetical protein [Acidimicrobiaceae bacterium]MDQ1399893.1 hypothetical protein [Acidimicrobiaceae bacterium]MDQ1414285.1 hypothetical protein [Acidimicrobiaceae bacterium]MDQ1417186.1 hypothetical protein [Acidimicrobiaceae bacterium]
MLNAQIARARIADRNGRAKHVATNRWLLESSRPEKHPHRHRWRSHRIWSTAAERTPIQA